MKSVTLIRPKDDFNQGISYKIYVGNNLLNELKNGEEKTIEIPSELEEQSLKAEVYKWSGSERIELRSLSDRERLYVKGNKFLNTKTLFIIVFLNFMGILIFGYGKENIIVKNIGLGLSTLSILFIFGIIVFGRNKWLNIKK